MFLKCDCSFQMQFTRNCFWFFLSSLSCSCLALVLVKLQRSSLNGIFVYIVCCYIPFAFAGHAVILYVYTISWKLNRTIILPNGGITERKDFLSLFWHAVNGVNFFLKRFFLFTKFALLCYLGNNVHNCTHKYTVAAVKRAIEYVIKDAMQW